MINNRLRITLFLVGLLETVCSEREHKVHNIVLYPEKHSWCQTTPIQQIVASPGFEPVTIDNNVCVGACYSYSIPKTQPAEPGELIGPYCDSCQPSKIKCYHVNLSPDEKNLGVPKLQKRVQIIINCSCQSCDEVRKEECEITDENTLELPQDLFRNERNINKSSFDDLADLLEAPSQNNTRITDNDIKLKNKFKKWFEIYQNETDQDGFNLNDHKYKTYFEKYSNQENKAKLENDLENFAETFNLKGISHSKGLVTDMGAESNENDIMRDDLKNKYRSEPNGQSQHSSHHYHTEGNHLHHLGEEQHIGMNVVHLIKGPHGSMVASPVEAKLHIDSDALKPNDEGIVIDYENHHEMAE